MKIAHVFYKASNSFQSFTPLTPLLHMKGNTTNLTGNWGNLNAPVHAIATDTMATGCVSFCFQENEQQVRELAVCGLPNQGAKGNRSSLVHFTVVELLCTTGWSRPKLTAAMQRTLQHTLLCFTGVYHTDSLWRLHDIDSYYLPPPEETWAQRHEQPLVKPGPDQVHHLQNCLQPSHI